MATIPYSEGVSDVQPTTQAPNDLQRIDTSPAIFGGAIATGERQLSAGASQASQVFGQIQTDDAVNNAMDAVSQHLDQFRTLRGADALNAQASTREAINNAITQARSGLDLPEQQRQFDDTLRSYRTRYVDGMLTSHAAEQAQIYATGVAQKQIDIATKGLTSVANDPAQSAAFQHDIRDGYVKLYQQQYGQDLSPDLTQDAILKADQLTAKTRAEVIGVQNPSAAATFIEQNKDMLGEDYASLVNSFRSRAIQEQAPVAAQNYVQKLTGTTSDAGQSPIGVSEVTDAIWDQESGRGAAASTSAAGAVGAMQIKPATFQQYAQPGESITNLDDQKKVASRIIEDGMNRGGGDPRAGMVAYFSGAGNVAPPGSPTPWKVDYRDPNSGLSVSQYVNQVSAKTVKSGMLMDKANVFAQIDKDYADNPQMAQAVKENVSRQFAIYGMAQQSQQLAQQAASEQSHSQYVSRIIKGDTGNIVNDIANDPNLTGEQKENLYDFSNKAMTSKVGGDAATYGTGFDTALSRINLAPGDPNRITNISQIIDQATRQNDLNISGVEKLSSILKDVQQPEGSANAKIQQGALAYAKHQLSFEEDNGLFKIPDPKGMDAYNVGFLPAFYKAWDAKIAAGKGPLTREEQDQIIGQFKRSPAELMKDRQAAGLSPDNGGNAAYQSAADIKAAYLQGKFGDPTTATARQAAMQQMVNMGFAMMRPANPVPMVQ